MFIDDELLIECLDEDVDFIVFGESEVMIKGSIDVFVLVDLFVLIEDELLLLMFLFFKYDVCVYKY